MCERRPEDTWYSYVFRQVCEKSLAVLAVAGFIMLYWYSQKADENEEKLLARSEKSEQRLIEIIREAHSYQANMTQALQELTFSIQDIKRQ